MVRREVRHKIEELKEIIELWIKFSNLIRQVQANKAVTSEEENEFLNIKTALARKQQVLSSTPLKLMNLLSQATTLVDIANMPELQVKKFHIDWHETYLSLNELLGRMESGKIEADAPRRVKWKRQGRGCLHNLILFIVFLILIYIALRIYDAKRNLISKIRETSIGENQRLEKTLQKMGFKGAEESEQIDESQEGEIR